MCTLPYPAADLFTSLCFIEKTNAHITERIDKNIGLLRRYFLKDNSSWIRNHTHPSHARCCPVILSDKYTYIIFVVVVVVIRWMTAMTGIVLSATSLARCLLALTAGECITPAVLRRSGGVVSSSPVSLVR